MSVKVSNWAWHEARDTDGEKLTGNMFILLLALADVADDSGFCRYVSEAEGLTYDGLATKMGVDRRTIERLIPRLREQGLIEHRRGVKGRANEFEVLVPWGKRSADTLSGNGQADSPTAVQDSPTAATGFPDNSNIHSSYRRIDVTDVSTSAVAQPPVTPGQRYAQPLCDVLAVELQRNQVKYSITKKWLADARLLVDVDGRDPHEARALIEWACRDSFWRSNILSMPTFRKNYDKLRLARERVSSKPSTVEHGKSVHDILTARQQSEQRAVSA